MNELQKGEILMYQTEDGLTKIEVELRDETVWLSLDQMEELFQRDKSTVSRHIKNIFAEGELERESTVAKYATVQTEGDRLVAFVCRKATMLALREQFLSGADVFSVVRKHFDAALLEQKNRAR